MVDAFTIVGIESISLFVIVKKNYTTIYDKIRDVVEVIQKFELSFRTLILKLIIRMRISYFLVFVLVSFFLVSAMASLV